ncbi:MAG: hypothetical protein K2G51_13930 [Lachnospiraceae bacterium]|nr:hypothetical protein [Lachnospiraceae bacterium]
MNKMFIEGKRNVLLTIIGIRILSLTGCESRLEENLTEETGSTNNIELIENSPTESSLSAGETWIEDAAALESRSTEEEEPSLEDPEREVGSAPIEVPQLPGTGREIGDFVPEGWELLDSVELDFNEDGIPDYVGVLEVNSMEVKDIPRILFAIASDETDGYYLNFQDINLIRTRNEGGVNGDPYQPLSAEGTSFTTCAYGGSAWRWSESNTYTYCDGAWWLTSSEDTYGYIFGDTTSYGMNDWESGVGIRKQRSSEFSDMEENEDTTEYDVVYELSLDEPLTLEQAGKRLPTATKRVTDWEVKSVVFGTEVELSESQVKLPNEVHVDYCDEDCVLYTFSDEDFDYLAMYRWKDKVLSVLAKEETATDYLTFYKGKIYYTAGIEGNVTYRIMQEGKEQITQKEETVGIRLNRMDSDGTGKETIFEYRYPGAEQETMEDSLPYLSLIYEISGDEIVLEVYIGEEPHPFYRMNVDGSGIREIGRMPKE